jgi:PhoPQ-activated pathogenicity-related protein
LPARGADSPITPPDLTNYVGKDDKAFAWKLAANHDVNGGKVYELDLISQTWQGITWTHKIQIFVPAGVKPQATMVLWNQGGSPSTGSGILGLQIANKVGAPVAFLYGIPNQPLFGGKREDALIAETFVRFLETKDSTWPLLFPMVKSLVKAMDAIQAFAKEKMATEVTGFVVTGASKRGWTSWLTAASGDKRVKAIAPLVIDTLNMPVQMENQVKAFGKPSEMIRDYTARNLVPIPETGEGQRLWKMIDPWVYRERITVPKMIINGTNDPYWPLDALNSYWDDLKGERYVLYVPNAGHDLREVDAKGNRQLIPERSLNTLSAFSKCQIFGKEMPKLTWVCEENVADRSCRLALTTAGAKSVRVWSADAATRDFRKARWTASESSLKDTPIADFRVVGPEKGFRACFAEADYEIDGVKFTLSTQLRIQEGKK